MCWGTLVVVPRYTTGLFSLKLVVRLPITIYCIAYLSSADRLKDTTCLPTLARRRSQKWIGFVELGQSSA